MKYLGIDPGFSGAWGLIDHHGQYISTGDMTNNKEYLLTNEIYQVINEAIGGDDVMICIEHVHSYSGQGVASTFKFGMSFGCAIAIAQRIKGIYHFVRPQVWKKAMNVTADKESSLRLARYLFPDAPLSRKKDNGRAESLLMAEYLRRIELS